MAIQMQLEVILAGNLIATRGSVVVSRCSRANNGKEMYKKSVLHMQSWFFAT